MYKCFLKRLIDIAIAMIGLPILLLLTIILIPVMKLFDHGPVFYICERIGRNERIFKMIKFRTMIVNVPDIRFADGSTYNAENDPRVTGIGKFLRETSLDEVPQIINVLTGNMSIIGPRPDPPDCLNKYGAENKVFLTIRPGITGYNQAYFRNSTDFKAKMRNDIYYALNYSFWMDIKILFRTAAAVFKVENMYRVKTSDMLMARDEKKADDISIRQQSGD